MEILMMPYQKDILSVMLAAALKVLPEVLLVSSFKFLMQGVMTLTLNQGQIIQAIHIEDASRLSLL